MTNKQHEEGLLLTSSDDISIDSLQGVVSLSTMNAAKINLHTVENSKLIINAPNSHLTLNLKSLHDISYINCKSADLILSEMFDQCTIWNMKEG